MTKFTVSLFEMPDDIRIGPPLEVPFLPHPGMIVYYGGLRLEVLRVEISLDRAAKATDRFPPMADVIVRRVRTSRDAPSPDAPETEPSE